MYSPPSSSGPSVDLSGYAPLNSPGFTGTPTVPTATLGDNSTKVASTAFVHANASSVPTGTVISGYFVTPPEGYVFAAGDLLIRADYPNLYAHALANSLLVSEVNWSTNGLHGLFSVGNGSTTFRMPDLRDEFIRGTGAGRSLGTSQLDSIQNIIGSFGSTSADTINAAGGTGAFAKDGPTSNESGGDPKSSLETGYSFDASRVVRTSSETRPRNIALTTCIKY